MLKFFTLFILIAIAFSGTYSQDLKYGVVHDSVRLNNTDQFYSIYIPSDFSEEKVWPLVFFFDPAARASLPIKLYSNLAEKYGFIAVCTYNSRNGPFEPGFKAFDVILRHLINTYTIDQDNLITSGFSGGARLALALAVESKIIKGVIACGAGQPAADFLKTSSGDRYSYASIVGNLDFNYLELLNLDKTLGQQNIRNERFVFHGAHRWPPEDYFELAYLWIRSNDKTATFGDELKKQLAFKADSLLKAGNYLMAESFIESLDSTSKPAIDIANLKSVLQKNKKQLHAAKKDWEKAIGKESKVIEELTNKLLEMDKKLYLSMNPSPDSIDTNDWSYYIKKYKRKRERSTSFEAESYQRILSFISANMAERSFTYTRRELYGVAKRMTEVWLEVNESNVWANFSMAKLHVLRNNDDKAIIILNKLLEENAITVNQIEANPVLKKLVSSSKVKIPLVN